MKLIKLDRRHHLYHKGYRFAFVVDRFTKDTNRLEKAVTECQGYRYDSTFWGKAKTGYRGYTVRPYYIGLRNEATATLVMLKL